VRCIVLQRVLQCGVVAVQRAGWKAIEGTCVAACVAARVAVCVAVCVAVTMQRGAGTNTIEGTCVALYITVFCGVLQCVVCVAV